ncbi:T9SS type A sorting domain-containing protein [Flavobacterium sp. SM2513]|uniref:T9SS type A sorting domain-containing protein n=1 Tax=Flavobacterium sp. SM2513 TaxID=3424766 RepID=UPI003D7F46ED
MKKITLTLVFLLTMVMGSYGQVAVGEGTNTAQVLPFNAYYGYTYSQSIYLASEINAAGSITSIQWYFTGATALPNSQGLTIYLGQTSKTNFDSNIDYVAVGDLTEVYTGGIVTGSTAGWKTITFTTPFPYDGISNLIVAVDENMAGYDDSADDFRNTNVGSNRSISSYSDSVNTNPADPSTGSTTRGMVAFVPNVIFGGITQACGNPTNITTSLATTTEATIGWTAAVGQVNWEVYVVEQSMPAPTPSTVGLDATGTATFVKTGLLSNTGYNAYVRAKCSETMYSGWSGPKNFRTLCDPFGDFNEDFDAITAGTGVVPNCWTKTVVSANANANVSVITNTSASTPNALYMTNSADETAQIYLATPALSTIGANTHRMKFKARGGVTGQILVVGTMSDPTDASTFVELQSYTLTNAYSTYNVTLNTSTTANHIAFKHGLGGTYRSVYLDDIIWEPIPTTPPGCIQDLNALPNEGCGNFATVFTWSAVPGADGYKVSIGTSANGQDLVVDNLDIYSVLSYSFVGNISTTYYYTIKPYNANGPAVNCFEDMFTTYGDGCYCVSVPASNDGAGISSVQINNVVTPVTDVMYASFIENGAIDITQGVNTIMNVSLATGTGYFTNVWVDFNNNYTFEASELVYTGESGTTSNPFVLNTSFMAPITAGLGQHRLRIGATDYLQTPPNPCFGDAWGVTLDFLVNVLEAPTCLPPSASTTSNITATGATLNWVSQGTLFNIEVDFAGFTQGTGVVTSGIAANTTMLENLDPQQDYAYYLQTDCGSGSLSPWTGPFTFKTGCTAFGDFTEDFTTEVSYTVPECFKSLIVSTLSSPSINVYNYNDYVSMNNSGNAAAELYFISPALDALPLATHRMKFKAFSYTAGASVIVGTMSDPSQASTFTPVQTIPVTTAFANYSVTFSQATTDMYVAFKFVGTGTYQTLYVDDLVWETAPLCADVNVVTFVGATSSSADIAWVPGGTETAWQYVYGPVDTTDPSGLIPVDVTTGPSTTIPGLLPSTTYKVWVRSSCGVAFGAYSEPITFTTACVAVTEFPWTEGFENITPGFEVFPNCWDEENGDYSTAVAGTYNTPRTGSNYLRNSWSATNEYMWTPGFELTAGVSYDFSFYMQGDGFTGWTVDVFHNTVQNSTGATQIGGTTTASGTGSYVIQPYALVSNTFVPTTDGTYYFAVRVNQPSGSPWYIAFDDFRMEPTPSCVAPMAPTATDITVSTATMNWVATTPAPAEGYDYYVTTATAAPNATTAPTGTVVAGVTTASLTSLSSSTVYRTYVRSICGTDELSSWSDAGMFTTPCAAFDAPFLQDFTSYVPLCWSTAAAGTVATGPTGSAAGIWVVDGFLNVGTTGAVKVNLYNVNRIGWLITPTMNTTVGEVYTLSFDYGVTDWNDTVESPMGSDDFVKIAMTTDNGVTWTEVESITAADNVTNMSQEFTHEFTATTAQVKFALIASDGTVDDDQDYDFFVDNLALETTLSTSDFDKNSFTAYPNPVKDMLNVSFTQNISNVTVYNLLGQQVLSMNMNANKGQVDMSNLATGTYLVKVNTETAVKTIKVIKE